MATDTTKKSTSAQPANNELSLFNPLMKSPVISVENETEQKVQAITEIESLAEINKQQLAVRRQRVELEVDNKKLDTAKKVASNLENILDILSDETVVATVKSKVKTALDYKLISEAGLKQAEILKNLMNPSVQDEYGNRKRTKILAQFQTPSGEKATMAVEVNNGD